MNSSTNPFVFSADRAPHGTPSTSNKKTLSTRKSSFGRIPMATTPGSTKPTTKTTLRTPQPNYSITKKPSSTPQPKSSMTKTPLVTPRNLSFQRTPSVTPASARKASFQNTTPVTPQSAANKYSMQRTPSVTPVPRKPSRTPSATPLSTRKTLMKTTPSATPKSTSKSPMVFGKRPRSNTEARCNLKKSKSFDLKNNDGTSEEEDPETRTVLVTNVHFSATKGELWKHFMGCGKIVDITMKNQLSTGLPTGGAYIEFADLEGAQKALSLNRTSFMYQELKVLPKSSSEYAIPKLAGIPSHSGRKLLNECWARRGVNVLTSSDIANLRNKFDSLQSEML